MMEVIGGIIFEWQLVVALIIGVFTVLMWPKLENRKKIKQKREEVRTRKAALEEFLSPNGELLDPKKARIVSLDVKTLLSQLRTGVVSPVEVLQAFQSKALLVDKETNAVCDFILESLDQARALERVPIEERGPLYGLPVSIKECFLIKGYDATVGLAS